MKWRNTNVITSEHKTEFLAGVREDFKSDFSWAYDCILQEALDENEGQVDEDLLDQYLNSRLTTRLNRKNWRNKHDNQSNHP